MLSLLFTFHANATINVPYVFHQMLTDPHQFIPQLDTTDDSSILAAGASGGTLFIYNNSLNCFTEIQSIYLNKKIMGTDLTSDGEYIFSLVKRDYPHQLFKKNN